jgi:molybdopterin/thiamine biosynthesis adenylyltransferase
VKPSNCQLPFSENALIKTQTIQEKISSSDFAKYLETDYQNEVINKEGVFNRSSQILGLDVLRQIMNEQVISVVGVGGTGSIIAEHLIHMGFHRINLIDPDILEVSNMNRIVGVCFKDAKTKKHKVDVIKTHLCKINPRASINAYKNDVYEDSMEEVLALSDWIIVATDNHSSRFRVQQLSFKYFVPFISLGVNITINDNFIEDMSGEVTTVRMGDRLCLNCLKRIDPLKVANERHPEEHIRKELVVRGYVTGKEIKEPAVKTLNCITATLAVDILINQYTGHQRHVPIIVYENNGFKAIFEDNDSIRARIMDCFTCNV